MPSIPWYRECTFDNKKPMSEILLSDAVFWLHAYSYQAYVPSSDEEGNVFDLELQELGLENEFFENLPSNFQKRIVQSYDRIFDLNNYSDISEKSLQATFWSLKLSEVIKVEYLIAR